METVTLDFEFKPYSYEYGRFLTICHEGYPDAVVSNGSAHFWNYYKPNHQMMTVDVPAELAVILKLTFGDHLRVRPSVAEMERLKRELIASSKDTDSIYKHINSNKKIEPEYEDYKLINIYNELKEFTKFKSIKSRL
jgi:hypothetical protein